ncbi:MAG: metallophosphoesterase [Thermoguttaceae bacterium]|nr:metallophosphoesterase [Thermoguttaceae bacterium]
MRVDKLPRRDFLKTASLLAGAATVAPEKTFAQDGADDVILRFAVTSDTHFPGSFYPGFFPGNSQETQKSRLAKAIRLAVDYASAQPYERLDAFAVCGDMTNRGVEEELVPFCETLDAALPAETQDHVVGAILRERLFGRDCGGSCEERRRLQKIAARQFVNAHILSPVF